MQQLMYRFASREAFLAACPADWLGLAPDPTPPPDRASLVILGTLWDAVADPDAPPVPRPGFHVLALFVVDVPPVFQTAAVPRQAGDPVIPGEDPPPMPPSPDTAPLEITRAQARVAMAAYILPDGRSLLTATRELLQAQLDATTAPPAPGKQHYGTVGLFCLSHLRQPPLPSGAARLRG